MPVSIRRINTVTPRAERELLQPIDNKQWKDWSQIMEDSEQVRTTVKNLEGDFPKPSSHAPDRGILQYYYHLDADSYLRTRYNEAPRGINEYPEIFDNQGTAQATGVMSYSGTEFIYAPRNNSWETTVVLDDYKRDMQNRSEQGRMLITITPPATTESRADLDRAGVDQYQAEIEVVDTLPLEIGFTTNAERSSHNGTRTRTKNWNDEQIEFPNVIYVKAGSKIQIEYSTQEAEQNYPGDYWTVSNGTVPNEDYSYLEVPDYAGAWETGRPWKFMDFNDELNFNIIFEPDWDPYNFGQLKFYHKTQEDPSSQTAELRVKDTNGYIMPEPYFGNQSYYRNDSADTYLYWAPWVNTFEYDRLESEIQDRILYETDETSFGMYEPIPRIMHADNRYPINIGVGSYGAHGYTFSPDPKHFWSVGSVSWCLYKGGSRAFRGQSALDYVHFGNEVDWRDWTNVRINDVAVFKFKGASGGHVGFIRDVDLENNKVKIAGGNQGNKFKETEYLIDSSDMYLLTVRRNWPDPGVDYKLPGLS